MSAVARVALVTGVSRRAGIGLAIARRLHDAGVVVIATGWEPHDAAMPWGADPVADSPFEIHQHDLADPAVPAALIDAVVVEHGAIDMVIAVHARSSSYGLLTSTADELDACWAVNVRSVVLLARRLAEVHDANRPGGRMMWFTSGQSEQPMPNELPYAITKAALHQMTGSLADALIDHGIVANCINPGPVDTGWASPEVHAEVRNMFPTGRWGTPADVANLVAFLASDDGGWIQGQVINSEGGFRRSN
jgi:3-oxoacyl-[acyl-carrier protein] reductase